MTGASDKSDRAFVPAASSPAVSTVPASIPCAGPTLDERNEGFIPPHFDMSGGRLGETPILWQFRMAYEWQDHFEEEKPEWDQCCTCWLFAVSEGEARAKVWDQFKGGPSVMPIAIASCCPERFRNAKDDERDTRSAQAIEARRAETAQHGSVADESAVPTGCAHPSSPSNSEGQAQ